MPTRTFTVKFCIFPLNLITPCYLHSIKKRTKKTKKLFHRKINETSKIGETVVCPAPATPAKLSETPPD